MKKILVGIIISLIIIICGVIGGGVFIDNLKEYPIIEGEFNESQVDNVSNGEEVPKEDEPSKEEIPPKEENNNNIDEIANLINSMSLEEKVGQMFMVRHPLDVSTASKYINEYHLGGYIMFARDFENRSKDEVITMIATYQNISKIPMLIGVDEEGGTVNRISKYKKFRDTPFASPQELYASGGFAGIKSDTLEKAEFLKSFGINVNFAPVADVSTNPSDYIYKRSFGQNATLTSEYVSTVVNAMNEAGIGSVLKHFPGYGNNLDTHTGISIDNRSLDSFRKNDFLPFEAGIKAGADIVLVSHNIITSVDADNPASLSKNIHEILRNDLGFGGVIITDDLYMDAISSYLGNEDAAVKAVLAGNDLICTTDFETQIPAVIEAVKDGTISEEQINESVYRILKLKVKLDII